MNIEHAKKQLEWYWNQAESEVGFKSNFGAALERYAAYDATREDSDAERMHISPTQTCEWEDPYTKGVLISIERARFVRDRLAKLPTHLQNALFVFYGDEKRPDDEILQLALSLHEQAILAYMAAS